MDIYIATQVLISGVVSGFILFQTAFVAPTVFTKVDVDSRPLFLRSIFPKLFGAMTFLGALFTVVAYLGSNTTWVQYVVGIYTAVAGLSCRMLVPATNKAKDEGDQKTFAVLHKISVFTTILALLFNIIWIFYRI